MQKKKKRNIEMPAIRSMLGVGLISLDFKKKNITLILSSNAGYMRYDNKKKIEIK